MPPVISLASSRDSPRASGQSRPRVDPDDLVDISSVAGLIDENDLYCHPDHGERHRERLPQRGVTQGGRETFGEKGLSRLQAGHGALKVRALFGIVQDGGIAVTDPPQDGDDRVHIIRHLPADGVTTPFCIILRSTQPSGGPACRPAIQTGIR
jgi:hypothetical protein